jgi:hypothetical protein
MEIAMVRQQLRRGDVLKGSIKTQTVVITPTGRAPKSKSS